MRVKPLKFYKRLKIQIAGKEYDYNSFCLNAYNQKAQDLPFSLWKIKESNMLKTNWMHVIRQIERQQEANRLEAEAKVNQDKLPVAESVQE